MLRNNKNVGLSSADAAYNRNISSAFILLTVVFGIALVLYVGVTVITDTDLISYENLYYMMNDFNIAAVTTGKDYKSLSYDYGANQTYGKYRNGLVILNENTITAFSSSGKRTLYEKNTLKSPQLLTCDEYIIVYEKNGASLYIYNSFSPVFTEDDLEKLNKLEEYSIIDVAAADNGIFAIALNTGTSQSKVLLYSRQGRLMAEYTYPDYVVDVSLNGDGTKIAISYISGKTSDGEFVSESLLYMTDSQIYYANYKRTSSIPVDCSFTTNGSFLAIYSDCVVAYNDGALLFKENVMDEGFYMSRAEVNNNGCIVYYKNYEKYEDMYVKVFDKSGNVVYNVSTAQGQSSKYHSYIINNMNLYCCYATGTDILSLHDGTYSTVDCGFDITGSTLVIFDDNRGKNTFIVCSGSEGIKY